jgi:succinyl-CoA synthetase beta subunit
MQLFEFQAKRIFKENGISVPEGRLALSAEEAGEIAEEINAPVMVKAQVLSGGRGLAGGVKCCEQHKQMTSIASQILNMNLKGEKTKALLIEEKLDAAREIYAAITWDYPNHCPTLIGSSIGGVDIETVTREDPTSIVRMQIGLRNGFSAYRARELATMIGLKGGEVLQYASIMSNLWHIFENCDAELVEINPLAVLKDGKFIALDAKMSIDDKSTTRQSRLLSAIEQLSSSPTDPTEQRQAHAKTLGIPTYFESDGNIGVIADGAGSGMLTLDLVADHGGRIRVYCEMGGEITPRLMENTMLAALAVDNVKVLLINLIGGLNRMDEMALGISNYLKAHPTETPIIVRMSGTKQDEGRTILAAIGVGFLDNLYEAAKTTSKLVSRLK